MRIDSIKAKNFRNLTGDAGEMNLEFGRGVNILCGANAQGKTNIIEAVYFSATAHSHRTSTTRDMIAFGQEFAAIRAVVGRGLFKGDKADKGSNRLDVLLRSAGRTVSKRASVNGVGIERLSDLLGVLYCVIFSPEDLNLIKSGPAERRRFMDMELCQVNRVYYFELKEYHKILRQRNALLKSLLKDPKSQLIETLDLWDTALAERGERIAIMRRAYIQGISALAAKIHAGLCKEELSAVYKSSAEPGELAERLRKNRKRDIMTGATSVGVHKDDVAFLLDGLDSRTYGSQGQQRTAALSIKLAEVALIRRDKGESPVLLLDDVFSELDRHRQDQLLDAINGIQTIISCTTADNLSAIKQADRFLVQGGRVCYA